MSESFVYDVPKTLPVILLLDKSGSMCGEERIGVLNNAVNTMLKSFRDLDSVIASISVAIITFDSNAEMVAPLALVSEVKDINLEAGGMTALGAALRIAKNMIEAKETFPSRSYRPAVICISDGAPNDDWRSALTEFKETGRSSKCHCMSMYIGDSKSDEGYRVMKMFAGDDENVFFAESAKDIHKFFRFITTTIKTRTQSANPNLIPTIDLSYIQSFGDDDLLY